ncbi:MAG: hypothetical protein ACREBQ_07440, partial [Nitrososphaerales archaeon]
MSYIQFGNISHLFMSYIFNNGSQFRSRHNFSGPPNYGPPGYNYALYGLWGFPGITGSSYLWWNGTGFQDTYKSWTYWFTASNLIVVPASNQQGNQTIMDL